MKIINTSFQRYLKKNSLVQLTTLTIAPLLLLSCGGGGGSTSKPGTSQSNQISSISQSSAKTNSSASVESSVNAGSSVGVMSSPSVSSNASSLQTSSGISQSSSSPTEKLTDVSSQFTAATNNNFYVFSDSSNAQLLRYLPKQLALTGLPGIASVQRTNKISVLQKMFFDLSDSDWTSTNQLTFSSRYTLDVDLQKLTQESEALGYTTLADIKVKPPVMTLEQRYTTAVPSARIQIQCKNLTLLINGNEVTLHDCNLADSEGIIATQPINHIGNFRYEALNFDPDAISSNKSLRGTMNIDYTLPGTHEFDRLLSTNNGDLQSTWQLYFAWPLTQTNVSSATATVNWKTLLADLKTQVSAGKHSWDEEDINAFTIAAIVTDTIAFPKAIDITPALHEAIISYVKQELFVAIYANNSKSPFTWAPKLRVKNVEQPGMQNIAIRYFNSTLPLVSHINLSCLTAPDGQNNIYKAAGCEE
jgi:hypothetical protein